MGSIISQLSGQLDADWKLLGKLIGRVRVLRYLRDEFDETLEDPDAELDNDEEDFASTYTSIDHAIQSFEECLHTRTDVWLPMRWERIERLLYHVDSGPVSADVNSIPVMEIRETIDRICSSTVDLIRAPRVQLIEFTPRLYEFLLEDARRLYNLSDEEFELLIADRLAAMGMDVVRSGAANRKDGGIDLIAVPRRAVFPFVLAGQVKHHRRLRKTGVRDVRDFHGAVSCEGSPFHMGVIVTNTTFTPDARFFAERNKKLLRLRDIEHLCQWMRNSFTNGIEWREIPSVLELAPGVQIEIPR